MDEAKRTDPDLWERVKAEVTAGAKGGRPGEWSARKAQMSVREYKRRGGGYDEAAGASQEDTSLHRWTAERWGTKSGGESGETGERYLPKTVRMLLTEDEYARTTGTKRRGREQFVDQPEDVREKAASIRRDGPTRAMLDARAGDLGIEGRTRMGDAALLRAIEAATDDDGRGPLEGLGRMTKAELMARARERGVEGRSRMSKDALVRALGERDAVH